MPSYKIQNLKGGVILESKNRQQYEGNSEITFKVTLKSWPKYYVILLSEMGTDEQVEISPQTYQLMEVNRQYANILNNIQATEMYDLVGAISGQGSFERSVMFKLKNLIDWDNFLRDDE